MRRSITIAGLVCLLLVYTGCPTPENTTGSSSTGGMQGESTGVPTTGGGGSTDVPGASMGDAAPALGIELSHAILAPGRPVRAVGEALIKRTESGLVGVFISSYSGHFFRNKPGEGASVLHLGEAAFEALGIRFAKRMPICATNMDC